jgi:hypothetical protein
MPLSPAILNLNTWKKLDCRVYLLIWNNFLPMKIVASLILSMYVDYTATACTRGHWDRCFDCTYAALALTPPRYLLITSFQSLLIYTFHIFLEFCNEL